MIDLLRSVREVQLLHQRIRTNKEKLHSLERKLREVRKGAGNVVR